MIKVCSAKNATRDSPEFPKITRFSRFFGQKPPIFTCFRLFLILPPIKSPLFLPFHRAIRPRILKSPNCFFPQKPRRSPIHPRRKNLDSRLPLQSNRVRGPPLRKLALKTAGITTPKRFPIGGYTYYRIPTAVLYASNDANYHVRVILQKLAIQIRIF
jgi:hypothetical protein